MDELLFEIHICGDCLSTWAYMSENADSPVAVGNYAFCGMPWALTDRERIFSDSTCDGCGERENGFRYLMIAWN